MKCAIASIETFVVNYRTVGHFKFFQGPRGAAASRPTVVIKVMADTGAIGWGQSVPAHRWSYETVETVESTIKHYLMPELIGLDPFDAEAIQRAMSQVIAPSFSTGQPICKAGIELALFDLTGKLLGQGAAQRWKKSGNNSVALSWTVNERTVEEAEKTVTQGLERGYRSFNIKIAPDANFDVQLCKLVKNLAPRDAFVWVDANGGYDEATALEVAPRLADLGVPVFEQPLPANRLTGYQRLKKQGALPIIMDEGIVSSVELEEFIRLGMLDGAAIKVSRCGGVAEAMRQVKLLRDNGLWFLGSGLTDPDLSLAACLALFGAFDLKYPAALNGPQYLEGSILTKPFAVAQGAVTVPSGPGLGVVVDEVRIKNGL